MRILSLAPSNTEILFAIGAGSEVIGRTAYCDFPSEALKIPKMGDWVNPNLDSIKKLAPDIVLTSTIVQANLAKKLRDEGLPVLHLSPRDLGGVFESMIEIGEAVGAREKAEALVKRMGSAFDEIKKDSLSVGHPPRLYIEEWHNPPFVSGNWVPELADIAGAEYGMIKKGQYSREISTAEMADYDPELIVLSICGVKLDKKIILGRKGWENLSAVKNRNIHVFDDSLLNRPGPRLVEGARQLEKIISSWAQISA